MAERRCGTCKWWEARPNTPESITPAGECMYIIPMWAKVDYEFWSPDYLFETEGKDCPTWHPKTT